jgi:uncharacterized membrane protein
MIKCGVPATIGGLIGVTYDIDIYSFVYVEEKIEPR